ncbi:Lrp/AsnC family transcriptional regulator [Salinarimonas sp.]|uniref:Lrp/AsnC family transcriptional regulator n=1 Tax=Salinarimonas sp. TaxID=2766526 RepID=UPI00391B7D30
MDDTDQALVAALRRNARLSLSELAASLGLARATVRARLDRLVARGDIQGFTILTRAEIAPAPVRALTMIAIEGRGTERIVHRLGGLPEVATVHTTNGKWDLVAEIATDTLEDLDRVLTEIRRLEGVATSETSLLLSTRKGRATRTPP